MGDPFVAVPLIFIRNGRKQHVGLAVMNRYTYEIIGTRVHPSIFLTEEERELLNGV